MADTNQVTIKVNSYKENEEIESKTPPERPKSKTKVQTFQ